MKCGMKQRRLPGRDGLSDTEGVQLALAIGPARVEAVEQKPRSKRSKPQCRSVDVEPILWMRDVVELTGKHRCTIHRWIHEGEFPKKDAPKERPRGWLRSTYEQWLRGEHGQQRANSGYAGGLNGSMHFSR
jgi:predicted DNA-binding transcriptional regulator AlpA